jgi:ssRNA-specific RNase YbeY (16S rRNA maturation enzyme)
MLGEQELPLMDEMQFLLIHGFHHLLGYNDTNTTAKETKRMEREERRLLFSF